MADCRQPRLRSQPWPLHCQYATTSYLPAPSERQALPSLHKGHKHNIHDRGPHKDEHDGRQQPDALGRGAKDNGHRDNGEHELVEAQREARDGRRSQGERRSTHATPNKVGGVAVELAARLREGQREAEQEPLHGDHGDAEEAQHDERERVLDACQAAVEDAQSGCHEEHQRSAQQQEPR